jgi:hypothetical protein
MKNLIDSDIIQHQKEIEELANKLINIFKPCIEKEKEYKEKEKEYNYADDDESLKKCDYYKDKRKESYVERFNKLNKIFSKTL